MKKLITQKIRAPLLNDVSTEVLYPFATAHSPCNFPTA